MDFAPHREIVDMKAIAHNLTWLYRSMYYRLYRYSERADSKYSMHYANAAMNFSMILILNFGTLYLIYIVISGEKTSILDFVSVWVVGALGAGFGVVHTLFLGYKGRYKKIVSEFSKESPEQEHRRNLWAVWYATISFFSSIGFGVAWAIFR